MLPSASNLEAVVLQQRRTAAAPPRRAPTSWAPSRGGLAPGQPAADGGAQDDGRVEVAAGDPAERRRPSPARSGRRRSGGDELPPLMTSGCRIRRSTRTNVPITSAASFWPVVGVGHARVLPSEVLRDAGARLDSGTSCDARLHGGRSAWPGRLAMPGSSTWLDDHLHPHRRGAAAGDVLLPADRRGVRRQGRCGRRDPRHLARRADPRPVPGAADRRAAHRRRPRRARRAGQDARGQHHQAAQRLRLDPAAQGRDQGAAGAGLRPPGLPRRARRPTRSGTSARATTRSRARPSTRSCARATPTAGRRRR